ncbi:putative small periplasmic lipoprotein [Thiorhodovibrio litoralis]|nr:putative small periplasmic lipoprotein [Thiorhodovibrio litoralis]
MHAGLFLLFAFSLAACGQKGDLYLPDPKPAKPGAAVTDGQSSDQAQQSQLDPVGPTESGESLQDIDTIEDASSDGVIPAPMPDMSGN